MVYQDSLLTDPLALKRNSKFEILQVKIFIFNKKQIKHFRPLKKSHSPLRKQPCVPSDTVWIGNHTFK